MKGALLNAVFIFFLLTLSGLTVLIILPYKKNVDNAALQSVHLSIQQYDTTIHAMLYSFYEHVETS